MLTPPDLPQLDQLKAQLLEVSGGHGADHVFITAGGDSNGPTELAVFLARDRGRVIDIGKTRLDLPWKDYYEKELEVRFSRSYGPGRYDPIYEEGGIDYPIGYVRWTERRNMESFVGLLSSKRINLTPLVSAVYPFAEAVGAYNRMGSGDERGVGVLFEYQENPRSNAGSVAARSSTTGTGEREVGAGGHRRRQLCLLDAPSTLEQERTRQTDRCRHHHRSERRQRPTSIRIRTTRNRPRVGPRRPDHRRCTDCHPTRLPRRSCRAEPWRRARRYSSRSRSPLIDANSKR